MPKVSEEHRLAKQQEIITAALRAFERKGFQATSMAEIIAESGMSAGAIYGHFPSKAAIMREVATKVVSARLADLAELSTRNPMPAPTEMVTTIIRGMLASEAVPQVQMQVWGEAVTDPEMLAVCFDILHQIRATFVQYLTRWHVQAHGLVEKDAARIAREQAPLFISAVHGFVIQDSITDDFDREAYLTRTLTYLPS